MVVGDNVSGNNRPGARCAVTVAAFLSLHVDGGFGFFVWLGLTKLTALKVLKYQPIPSIMICPDARPEPSLLLIWTHSLHSLHITISGLGSTLSRGASSSALDHVIYAAGDIDKEPTLCGLHCIRALPS
ncbi:hypothetical protein C8R45DRAFT_1099074 [Mycena sanguinolenta]|nr:hypothetical protein C8R45DRAFT_1099074 [Mycena sanguinolenta]